MIRSGAEKAGCLGDILHLRLEIKEPVKVSQRVETALIFTTREQEFPACSTKTEKLFFSINWPKGNKNSSCCRALQKHMLDKHTIKLPYLFLKTWHQGVLSKNVKLYLLQAEQQGRFDHSEGLVQTIPTSYHGQVHDLLSPA